MPTISAGERLCKPARFHLSNSDINRILLSAVRYAAGRGTSMPYWVAKSLTANADRLSDPTIRLILRHLDETRMRADERDDWAPARQALQSRSRMTDDGLIDFPSMAVADFTCASAWRYEAEQSTTPDAAEFWTRMLGPLGDVLYSPNWTTCTIRDLSYGWSFDPDQDWESFKQKLLGGRGDS